MCVSHLEMAKEKEEKKNESESFSKAHTKELNLPRQSDRAINYEQETRKYYLS